MGWDGIILCRLLLLLSIFRFWSGRYLNFYLCLLFLLLLQILCVSFLLVVLTNCVLYDVVACNLLTLSPFSFSFSCFFPGFFFFFCVCVWRSGMESIADTFHFLF